jgi:ribonucleoside-diphosphate reductase alpha chain
MKYRANTLNKETQPDLLGPDATPREDNGLISAGHDRGFASLMDRLRELLKQPPPPSPALKELLHTLEERYLKQLPRSRSLESALDAVSYYRDNDLAIDVLRKKYLAPGERGPLHLWDRVARAIASVEKDPAYWYEKFLAILIDFRFVPGGRVMHGAGREDARRRPTLSNCFLAGTDVITHLGILPIEDVKIGNRVLTHTGKYQRVDNVLVREVDELIYTLTVTYNHSPLHCTGNHELLVLTKENGQWVEQWKAAETVQVGEYLKVADVSMDTPVPVPQVLDLLEYLPSEEVENEGEYIYQRTHFIGGNGAHGYRDTGKVYRYILVDYRFNKWLGYFYAEGGLLQVNGKNKGIYFTFHQEELGYVDEVMALTEELFGVIPTYNERNGQEGKWCRIYIHNKLLANFLSVFIGSRYNHNKTLPPWFLSQTKEHLKRFLSGLFRGDGFTYTQSKTGVLGIRLIMANPELIKQVYLILRKLNIVASFDPDYDNGTYQRHPTALINVATAYYANILIQWMADYYEAEAELKNVDFVHHYRVHNGALYFRVRSVQPTQIRTLVYNLSVAEDNTYTANFQVVHNCYVIPIEEDSLEGIYQCLAESAMVYRTGGGVGTDLSVLRPAGAPVNATIDRSPGATAFMNLFSESTNTVSQAGRRGALMLTLRVDHPDIKKFIHIKNDPLRLKVQYANISVLLTHLFMEKVSAEHDATRQQEICFEVEDEQGNRQNIFARPEEQIEYAGKVWRAEALYRHLKAKNTTDAQPEKKENGHD